ncbi:hypothetical protein [Candidatus Mycoplasma mahonii]|uniref:hypothetical protein n=1 Tax=Candidatus Mycoplasma mahonii TaxID=3004105 RepID=UPI0026F01564|nr:hypothetical protein [Candidatus Mycoplasma mahonii]WKX02690.1 hypothetical protein O3I44_01280 [Candidatus Mycoplasma mahonii]
MEQLIMTLVIVSIIAVSLSIVAIFYIIAAYRRRTITMKKVDYLVEDLTYKSESLSSTVKTVGKVSNYVDAFEVISKKNMKSAAKIIARNKDDIYKIGNRILELAIGKEKKKEEVVNQDAMAASNNDSSDSIKVKKSVDIKNSVAFKASIKKVNKKDGK